MSPETIKARVNRDSPPENKRFNLQRFSTHTSSPSESTDNTFATANSQQHSSNSHLLDSNNDNDDTIRVNLLSHHSPEEVYLDQTPTQENISDFRGKDYLSRRNVLDGNMESPMSPQTVGTGSIISSSSMWDELESIKRRLRKLELNHPSPSVHSPSINGGGDRPLTRGTATSSSSPQRSSPFPSHAGTSITSTSSPSTYPLLNAALTKLKNSGLSSELTHAIEITAQEAISLNLMAQDPLQSPSPRMVRRKVDGVCRGLTEICLALADSQQLVSRQQTRQMQYRAEDLQDSSPLSTTSSRQSMTLSRSTARRLSVGTNATSRTSTLGGGVAGSTISRARRPVHSVVGIAGEEFDEDGAGSTISRPGLSRYSTIQYRPPSRAATEIYGREKDTPPSAGLQRFSTMTSRRGLVSRHGQSMSDHQVPSDRDSLSAEPSPRPNRSSTFTPTASVTGATPPAARDDRRRTYFSSPPRARTDFSGLPTPPSRPVSMISPPRVNIQQRNSDSGERTDASVTTIRKRGTNASLLGEKNYHSDLDEVRGATLGRAATLGGRRSLGGSGEVRRTGSVTGSSVTRRNANGNGVGNGNGNA